MSDRRNHGDAVHIGEDWRIVGISGFTVRPPRARRGKPRASAFKITKINEILSLRPDLVLGFSDIQADIVPLRPSVSPNPQMVEVSAH